MTTFDKLILKYKKSLIDLPSSSHCLRGHIKRHKTLSLLDKSSMNPNMNPIFFPDNQLLPLATYFTVYCGYKKMCSGWCGYVRNDSNWTEFCKSNTTVQTIFKNNKKLEICKKSLSFLLKPILDKGTVKNPPAPNRSFCNNFWNSAAMILNAFYFPHGITFLYFSISHICAKLWKKKLSIRGAVAFFSRLGVKVLKFFGKI